MTSNVAQKNPEPAPRQIWSVTGGNVQRTVTGVSGGFVRYTVGDYHHACPPAEFAATGKCIGIETDRGRVTVGERRKSAIGPAVTVTAVDYGPTVFGVTNRAHVAFPDGSSGVYDGGVVARWPLLPSLAEAAKDAARGPTTVLSSESDYHAAAKRIAESTPVSYSDALRLVEYHGSEDAARIEIAAMVAGVHSPMRAAVSFCGVTPKARDVAYIERTIRELSSKCGPLVPTFTVEPMPQVGTRAWYAMRIQTLLDVEPLAFVENPADASVKIVVPSTVTVDAALDAALAIGADVPCVMVDVVPQGIICKTRGRVGFLGEVDGMRSVPKTNPRTEREARRREIDRILREDASKRPAFATARKCAVMARLEGAPPFPPEDMATIGVMCAMLKWLREYEEERGGMLAPSLAARNFAIATFGEVVMGVYERSRALP